MEQIYKNKMAELGYRQVICDIFTNWENVKDEILSPERKTGSGNGTIHIFLGAADTKLREEFSSYYSNVEAGEDPETSAIKITHYFLRSNIISMLGHVCQYCYSHDQNIETQVVDIIDNLLSAETKLGMIFTTSLFKLSLGSNKLRPYFKKFNSNGVFTQIIRKVLLPNSSYKITLLKNENNEYAAFWLLGFDNMSNFEADSASSYFTEINNNTKLLPLQQIFYGAPGTGKSNTIKREVDDKNQICFRTTFHPDSDYSTFVGCYKPSMKRAERLLSYSELIDRLSTIRNQGHSFPCHKFAAKYWESVKQLSRNEIKEILDACDIPESMLTEIAKGVAVGEELSKHNRDAKIVYTYTPQAFLKAYVKAWQTPEKPVFLIIEEINRGNCAQIFGDLFQLLDRKNGVSEYPINADQDMQQYLQEVFASYTELPEHIRNGEILQLPANLYIWATMNTSDQSLFPIDSAFKRRWDWKYMKIKNHPEEGYSIKIGESETDWWEFIQKINEIIASMTSSADKQLGYFFCKAKDGKIDEETFVSKVIFYLWNDVFKDYGFEDASLFRYTNKDGIEKDLTFPDFFDENGDKVDNERLADFVNKVMNWKRMES